MERINSYNASGSVTVQDVHFILSHTRRLSQDLPELVAPRVGSFIKYRVGVEKRGTAGETGYRQDLIWPY
jgi:hypothetical protein